MSGHRYTPEEKSFFVEYTPGHTCEEIQAAFILEFGWSISIGQVKGYMGNNGINNGLTGRFIPGQIPPNKGVKGIHYPGCEKSWFKKGNISANYRPVGSERIDRKDGYIRVKTKEPRTWELKHRVIWEQHHGAIPKGKCLIFLNGDKTDIRIENLALIDRKVSVRMNQSGLRYMDPDSTKAAIAVAELMSATGAAKRKKR